VPVATLPSILNPEKSILQPHLFPVSPASPQGGAGTRNASGTGRMRSRFVQDRADCKSGRRQGHRRRRSILLL